MSALPPLRRQIVVPAGPQVAFDVFTTRIGAWWPVERFSVYGEKATAEFRDGKLIETGPGGEEAVWGEVLDWQPPRSLRMTWHPGRDTGGASEIEVSFAPVADGLTLVTVSHSHWEELAARIEYGNGWPGVLAGYAAAVPPAPPASPEPVFLVLSHTPAPGVDNPFEHPGFAGHPAFLNSLRERGVLVAAGPFPASGEGMTIIKLADAAEVAGYLKAATEQDGSVADGVLEVRVRPWVVTLTGSSLL